MVHKRNDFLVSSPLATELRDQLIPLANRSADWKLNIGEIEASLAGNAKRFPSQDGRRNTPLAAKDKLL